MQTQQGRDARANLMWQMYLEGFPMTMIGLEFGLSRQRIHQIFIEHGLKVNYRLQRLRLREKKEAAITVAKFLIKATHKTGHGRNIVLSRKCKCDLCKEFFHAYRKQWKAKRRAMGNIPHGANAYNNYDCRCSICTREHAKKCAAQKQRRKARERSGISNG